MRILGSTIPIIFFLLASFINLQDASAQCQLACLGDTSVNLSLDQNCSGEVLLSHVYKAEGGCPESQVVMHLEYLNGVRVPTSPFVGRSELGVLFAIVTDTVTGNYCWTKVLIEDKLGPNIECTNDTVDCLDLPYYPGPVVTDNCFDSSEIDLTFINDVIHPLNCDPDFLKTMVRTWVATDGSGRTAQCDQTIFISRFDTANVTWPENHTEAGGNPLVCDVDYDLDGDGAIDPMFTGLPLYNGRPLEPGHYPECNLFVDFEDIDFGLISCRRKIMRMWRIQEWWCNTDIVFSSPQIIEIIDSTGPTIICPADVTISTTPGDCDADVYLPPAVATDDCSNIIRYDVKYPGGFLLDQNGGVVNLPVGVHTITYIAYDECLNRDTCDMTLTVLDQTAPVAVCDKHTVVSLTNASVTRVQASTFDDGSTDECGIDSFLVRRMTPACGIDDEFRSYVDFTCCDLANSPLMVVFRVVDKAGNYNECMVEVELQDKIVPTITCPPDITVSCQFPYDFDHLDVFGKVVQIDSTQQLGNPAIDPRDSIIIDDAGRIPYLGPQYVGLDGWASGSCDLDITQTYTKYINDCGIGFIKRVFTATTASGQSVSCSQYVSIEDFTPFGEQSITWPGDVVVTGSCGSDIDPDVTGRPSFVDDDCELIGVSDPEDWVFKFDDPSNPACFKVLRLWKVIDWCRYDANTQRGLWTHTQVIKVTDDTAPVITGCDDVSICSYDDKCENQHVDISINANDSCTDYSELRITYSIDLESDGIFDLTTANNPFADAGNLKNQASGTYPFGVHRIVWTVEDGCGNFTTCEADIIIDNCKEPLAYCKNGLSAPLGGVDRDGDGSIDWGAVEIWASDFDAGSSHPCYGKNVTFSFSPDSIVSGRTFTCDSIGRRIVRIYVNAPNGTQAYCTSFIDIEDNKGYCPPGSGNVDEGTIAGRIYTDAGNNIMDVHVDLQGGGVDDMSDIDGYYDFSNMPFGGAYTVVPDKTDHYLNGITANDLSVMRRHILDINELNSPYKHYAADVNNDGVINAGDIVILKKLLLGYIDELPGGVSWKFFDANCRFVTDDPLSENCAEDYYIPSFDNNMNVDFVGVKIGDLDGDVEVNLNDAQDRGNRELSLVVTDQRLEAGQTYSIPVRLENGKTIHALQLTYNVDPGSAIINGMNGVGMSDALFNLDYADRGRIAQVWADPMDQSFDHQDIVTLTITATKSAMLSEVLSVSNDLTMALGFNDEGKMNVDLKFVNASDESNEVAAFELFQNRPNPFNDETYIAFNLPKDGQIVLTVTDATGKHIYRHQGMYSAGLNEITIQKSELNATGVMYYRLDSGENSATKKMIMLQ